MARRTKGNRGLLIMQSRLLTTVISACFTTSPYALPTNPSVANGNASFAQVGSVLNVTNSNGAIINWNTFSIGASETLRFIQTSSSSSVLNRVLANDPSVLLGTLTSNGRVFLINQSGIMVGQGARIDVAGFVASTLNLSDANFLANKLQFDSTPNAGSVVNKGSITTPGGGSVYLVAPNVTNQGIITTPQGETILAAGQTVTLLDTANPGVGVEITGAEGNVTNLGQIVANAGRIGIYAGLINNNGSINANTVQVGKKGEILLRASKNIVLEPGSLISASGAAGGVHDGGTVRIVANDTLDMREGSAVRVDGGPDGGNGGFLELSGKQKIALNGEFSGRAQKPGYKFGSLLLDPMNITIGTPGGGSTTGGVVLYTDAPGTTLDLSVSALNGAWTNVNLAAVNNITINAPIATTDLPAGGTFSLTAGNNIDISAAIGSAGVRFAHDLTLIAGNDINVNAPIYLGSNALVLAADANIPAQSITSNGFGSVNIQALGSPVTVDTLGTITATGQNMNILGGLNNAVAVVAGGLFSASLPGDFTLQGGRLSVSGGATANATAKLQANAVNITAGGVITIAGGDNGDASARNLVGGATAISVGNASATLAATNSISLTAPTITIRGGDSNSANACCNGNVSNGYGTAILVANATVSAGTSITLNATTINIRGGDGNNASAYSNGINGAMGSGTAILSADALMSAGTNISLSAASNITIRGGDNNYASACCNGSPGVGGNATASLSANTTLSAVNDIVVSATTFAVRGGYGNSASACCNGINGAGTAALSLTGNALVSAGRDISITAAGPVTIAGGDSGSAYVCCNGERGGNGSATITLSRNAEVSAGRNVSLTAMSLMVRGGDNNSASACCNGTSGGVGNATITSNATGKLLAGQDMTLNITSAPGTVNIRGGDNNSVSACCNGSSNGIGRATISFDGSATVQAGATLTLNASSVAIRGGDSNYASACCNGSSSGNVVANISHRTNATVSATTMLINTSSLSVSGGSKNSGSACCNGSSGGVGNVTVLNESNALLSTSGGMALNLGTGSLTVAGGDSIRSGASSGGNANVIVSSSANASVTAGSTLSINGGGITIRGGDNAFALASGSGSHTAMVTANGLLAAGSTMNLSITGGVTVRGGNNASAIASFGTVGGRNDALVKVGGSISAGGLLTLNAGNLTVQGGVQPLGFTTVATGTGANFATTLANADITGAADVSYSGGSVSLLGGTARTLAGAGTNTAIGWANAEFMAAGNKTLNITGDLSLTGGQALDDPTFVNPGRAQALAVLDPGTLNITTSGNMALTGGFATGVGQAYTYMTAAGPINLTIGGAVGLTLTGGASGPVGTAIQADPSSPITLVFTGGGTQNIVNNPLLGGAGIQTTPPPSQTPPPIGEEVLEFSPIIGNEVLTSFNKTFTLIARNDELDDTEDKYVPPSDDKTVRDDTARDEHPVGVCQ